jgi:hypothetical protein
MSATARCPPATTTPRTTDAKREFGRAETADLTTTPGATIDIVRLAEAQKHAT